MLELYLLIEKKRQATFFIVPVPLYVEASISFKGFDFP